MVFDMTMDLRQLRHFIVVAEEGHITRAAERLGMQQPPLSQRIKAIERELDVQLFHRKARGVELTAAGRALYDNARTMLAQYDHAIETTQRTARGEQGRISVGITPTGAFHPFTTGAIRAFRRSFPLVSLTLEEGQSNELLDSLRNDRIDAAFIRTPPADRQGILVTALPEEEMIVALPSEHVLAQGSGNRPVSMRALAAETFILQGGRYGQWALTATVAACHAAGFNPRVGQEMPRLASTLSLVAVGLGVSIVPASLQRLRIDGVAYRQIKSPPHLKIFSMLATRRGDSSPVTRHFINAVRQHLRAFPRG